MTGYKEMYFTLYKRITDVIEELQEVQRQTEEMYISAEVPGLKVAGPVGELENEKQGS